MLTVALLLFKAVYWEYGPNTRIIWGFVPPSRKVRFLLLLFFPWNWLWAWGDRLFCKTSLIRSKPGHATEDRPPWWVLCRSGRAKCWWRVLGRVLGWRLACGGDGPLCSTRCTLCRWARFDTKSTATCPARGAEEGFHSILPRFPKGRSCQCYFFWKGHLSTKYELGN